jgi:hypothetical protein
MFIKLVLFSPQAVAGLLADARSLADIAREEASNFRSNFGYNIPLKVSWQHTEEPFLNNNRNVLIIPSPYPL